MANARQDNEQISIGNVPFIKGAQLKQKFNSLKTVVTDSAYAPGGSGANYGDRFEINFRALGGYNNFGQAGINYLIFHELAHNTLTGITSRSWLINSYNDEVALGTMPANSYCQGNDYFRRQEAFANTVAKAMADSIGLNLTPSNAGLDWPPNGYGSF